MKISPQITQINTDYKKYKKNQCNLWASFFHRLVIVSACLQIFPHYSFLFLNHLTTTGIKAKTPKRKKAIKTPGENNSPGESIRPS